MATEAERRNARVEYTDEELRERAAAFEERFGETAPITAKQLLQTGEDVREGVPTETTKQAVDLTEEPAEDRVIILTRGRELMEQEQFQNSNPGAEWTLQQFGTNPVGEPWLALQQQNDDGVFRTLTGTREELDSVINEHHLTVTELPPITEGEYYRQAIGDVGLEPEIVQERQEESLELTV